MSSLGVVVVVVVVVVVAIIIKQSTIGMGSKNITLLLKHICIIITVMYVNERNVVLVVSVVMDYHCVLMFTVIVHAELYLNVFFCH